MALLLCVVGLLAVSVCSQAVLTMEVEAGDNVTLWCRHGLTISSYLFWCKHTNNSVPVYISCKYYKLSSSSSSSNPCIFISDSERVVMRVNSENSSLTIRSVTDSDSGLYYCSSLDRYNMIYSSSTYLQLREKKQTSSEKQIEEMPKEKNQTSSEKQIEEIPKEKNQTSSEKQETCKVYFMVTVVLGTVIVVLLTVLLILLIIILKYRKQQKEGANFKPKQENKDMDGEVMNYAALHFSNKKNRRSQNHVAVEDPNVVYSSVRQ